MAKPRRAKPKPQARPEPSRPGRWLPLLPRRRAMFYEQLGRMLKSGLPPSQALTSVLRTPWPPALRAVATDMAGRLQGGGALSEAMRAHAPVVDAFETAYLEASEAAGHLAEGFEALAARQWVAHQQLKHVVSKLLYPTALFVVASLLGPVPRAFASSDFSRYGAEAGTPIAWLVAGLAAAGWVGYAPAAAGLRRGLYGLGTRLPILAGLQRKLALAQLGQLLATCFRAGLPAATVFGLAAASTPDPGLAAACRGVEAGVHEGLTLTEGVARHPEAFPHDMLSVIEAGEVAGRLDEALAQAGAVWREDAEAARNALLRFFTGTVSLAALGMVALVILHIGLDVLGGVNKLVND